MRKNQIDGFRVVSAFSKPHVQYRTSFLLIVYLVLVSLALVTIYHTKGFTRTMTSILIISALVGISVKFSKLRSEFRRSPLKKLQRYINANKLYEDELRDIGYDKNGCVKQKRIIYNSAYFSYKVTESNLIIRAWKNADKFSEKANSHDSMFSALFEKELYRKYDTVQYCDYVFELVQDKRLTMRERKLSKGAKIQMTEKISWSLDTPPHTLIVGSTNSGKTYLISMLVLDYLRMGAELFIADPKSGDLSIIGRRIDIKRYGTITYTASTENEIARLFRNANEKMEERYKEWFSEEQSFRKNWKDFSNAKPIVLVIDEYSSFVSVSSPKIVKEINGYLSNLILKGRQAGIEVVMIMQRPDANILSGNLRDQFGVRIGLSNMTADGIRMLFGSVETEFKTIQEIGGGYIQIDGQHDAPVYFETPLMTSGMDYLEELDKAIMESENLQFHPLK